MRQRVGKQAARYDAGALTATPAPWPSPRRSVARDSGLITAISMKAMLPITAPA
jgi:hypothetical protein